MTARVIRYIWFSLYNCMEKTVEGLENLEKLEFHFAKFVSTLINASDRQDDIHTTF